MIIFATYHNNYKAIKIVSGLSFHICHYFLWLNSCHNPSPSLNSKGLGVTLFCYATTDNHNNFSQIKIQFMIVTNSSPALVSTAAVNLFLAVLQMSRQTPTIRWCSIIRNHNKNLDICCLTDKRSIEEDILCWTESRGDQKNLWIRYC